MQVENLRFDAKDLRSKLLPLLRGRVFHVTTHEGYAGILKDGHVHSNVDNQHAFTYPQSQDSYHRKEGNVCAFDLRDLSQDLDRTLQNYYFLSPFPSKGVVFLILDPSAHHRLIGVRGDSALPTPDLPPAPGEVIPHVEAGFPHSIPVNLITRAMLVDVVETPIEPSQRQFLDAQRAANKR